MTEAGKKWVDDKVGKGMGSHSEIAEYWVRAFCDAVQNRASEYREPDDNRSQMNFCKAKAFDDLKRELLGCK